MKLTSRFLIPLALLLVMIGVGIWYFGFRETSKSSNTNLGTTNSTTNTSSSNTNSDETCTPTKTATEGPYYKSGSPERTEIRSASTVGLIITLTGRVLDTNCQTIVGAVLDFWQADGNGDYDNSGYNLRGHQTTDAQGVYNLYTVIPGLYPGRTEHIHVKVRRPGDEFMTTQLFFSGVDQNNSDSIFDALLVVTQFSEENLATFDFVLK